MTEKYEKRKKAIKEYYESHKEARLEYLHNYYQQNRETILTQVRGHYLETRKESIARVTAYRKNNPEKHKAHWMVRYAIAIGKLIRQPCEMCGNLATDAHHDSYDEPLKVRWLCPTHHSRLHGQSRIERSIL